MQKYAKFVRFYYDGKPRTALLRNGRLRCVQPALTNIAIDVINRVLLKMPELFSFAKATHELRHPMPELAPISVVACYYEGSRLTAAIAGGIVLGVDRMDNDDTLLNKVQQAYELDTRFFPETDFDDENLQLRLYDKIQLSPVGTSGLSYTLLTADRLVLAARQNYPSGSNEPIDIQPVQRMFILNGLHTSHDAQDIDADRARELFPELFQDRRYKKKGR